jgi:hypothetical protein
MMASHESTNNSGTEDIELAELFLNLSRRCHEQNWTAVHYLAEQIVVHKRQSEERKRASIIANDAAAAKRDGDSSSKIAVTSDSNINKNCNNLKDGRAMNKEEVEEVNNNAPVSIQSGDRLALQQTMLSGEIMSVDTFNSNHILPLSAGTNINADQLVGSSIAEKINGLTAKLNSSIDDNDNAGVDNTSSMVDTNTEVLAQTKISRPDSAPTPSTPRMLSTCLGTASPLAWTCRYSAPSSTVKLVLSLDLSAVRRCLPQLGTPLHECVGRPRPLRKKPLKRGRWANFIANDSSSASKNKDGGEAQPAALASSTYTPSRKRVKKKKKKKQSKCPHILTGLREWRRTVRTLIEADETLLKEDLTLLNNEDDAVSDSMAEVWRRGDAPTKMGEEG